MYFVLQTILCILYFVFSIIENGGFNGWIRVGILFGDGHAFQGVVGIFESILYLVSVIFGVIMIFKVKDYDGQHLNNNNTGAARV